MKKAVYRLILFAAITAFVLSLSPSVKAEPNDTQTKQTQCIASDTTPLSNADKAEPAPHQKSAGSKENSQLQLAKEQLRGDFYKDSQDNLKWALGIIIAFVLGLIIYTIFKDKKEYEKACENAEKAYNKAELARTQAEKACDKAREYERQAQGVLANIEKQATAKLKEIEKTSRKQKDESSKEAERQRKISELFNKGWKADEAKDYETAAECFRQIVEDLKEENDPVAYNNWGTALLGLAKNKKGPQTEKLFKQAIEKFQKAIDIKPDFCESYHGWGNVLWGLAKLKKGTEEEELLNQAIEKFQKAIDIKQNFCEAYNNWGCVLWGLAKLKKGTEAEELLNQAIEKFQKAIDIKPNFCESYYGWGFVLLELAKSNKGPQAEKLFKQAIEKYQKALEIKADFWKAYKRWGLALLYLAKLKGGKDAEDILKQAEEKCLKAESLKTGGGAYNLACIYAYRGDEDECQEWLKVGEKAGTLTTRELAMADEDLKSIREKDWFKKLRWEGE